MSSIDYIEIELGGDKWKITWDTKTHKKIKTSGEKAGLVRTIYSLKNLTPEQAYDVAMLQLEWLKKDQVYVI